MKLLTISLPDDLAAALDAESGRRNVSSASIVQDAIRREVRFWSSDDLAGLIGIFDSGGVGPFANDVDDYLAAHWAEDIANDRDPSPDVGESPGRRTA